MGGNLLWTTSFTNTTAKPTLVSLLKPSVYTGMLLSACIFRRNYVIIFIQADDNFCRHFSATITSSQLPHWIGASEEILLSVRAFVLFQIDFVELLTGRMHWV